MIMSSRSVLDDKTDDCGPFHGQALWRLTFCYVRVSIFHEDSCVNIAQSTSHTFVHLGWLLTWCSIVQVNAVG